MHVSGCGGRGEVWERRRVFVGGRGVGVFVGAGVLVECVVVLSQD